MKHIDRLPEGVQCSMRSGIVICDFTRIVEELVLNSIDAGATEVSVAVGLGTCYVKVVDNGSGITRDGLVLLGERNATSKFDPLDMMYAGVESFDFHGETLCSLSDISLLEIVTKARGRPNGYKKILKNRRCLFLSISDDRVDAGTTVTVHDVFYNQPVRRKLMDSSHKVLGSIRMSMLRIALIHVNVSFRVVDLESASELLHAGPSCPPLSILFSNFRIEKSDALYRLHISSGALNVSGHISPPVQNFSLKMADINSRFVCKGPIHKLLNQLATKFDVLNSSNSSAGSQSVKRSKGQMGPVFILNLNCPRSYYDIVVSEQSRTSVEFKAVQATICEERISIYSRVQFILNFARFLDMEWGPVLSCIKNSVMNLWTENLSHDMPATFESGRKRSRIRNFLASVDLDTPQLKKLTESYDNVHAWEECISIRKETSPTVSKLKTHQSGACIWPDTAPDQSQSCHGVSESEDSSCLQNPCWVLSRNCYHFMGYSPDKRENGVSFPEERDLLPETNDDTNNMSMRSRTSVGCLARGDDLPITRDLRKSSLMHCCFQRSFPHDRTSSANDDRSEFVSGDLRMWEKWVDCDESIMDEIYPFSLDVQWNKARPFQASPKAPCDTHEGLDFMIRDPIDSFSDIITDSSKHFWNCESSQQSFSSGWSPMTTVKKIVGNKFLETLVESRSEFDDDSIRGYSREDDDLVHGNFSLKGKLLQQSCSIMNSFLYQKDGIGDYDWVDFENSPSQDLLKTFSEIVPSHLFFSDDKSFKSYSVSSLDHAPLFERECGRPNNTMQETTSNRRKISVRSLSAPPYYKGKKRFLGLSDSSSMSASSCQIITKTPLSTGLERTQETTKFQAGRSQKEQLTSMETVGSVDFQEIHNPLNSGWKWRKCLLPSEGYNKDLETILDISSDSLNLTRDSLVPASIDRTSFNYAKVLNQVDKKFIAVVAGETLVVIDQHAADERIRLEELRHKVLSGELRKSTYLDVEQEMVLPEIGSLLLHNYEEQIQKWGWVCKTLSQSTDSFTRSLDSLHRQATAVKLVAVPCIVGVSLTDSDLLEFIQQLDDTDGSSTIPPSVHRILNNKACRGAIMFGDTLLPSECSLIIEELKQTSQCFQCAHGRPTTVPLVNLAILRDQITKLGSQMSWHGLWQHELSILRSAQRLSSAIG
ncbi:hypothetical protein F511_16992 [Dorcoceras hygrometricum]|uniref:MutL C-terminal dimerisation domain-containing protein n=1 Tax=Dorcoceras hygrometricum TaxID=472368 RepID=A0A2Z7CJ89_9LAMI|nr:hypothetical protein F511_16992 [Dorcoceras hygrometricum]